MGGQTISTLGDSVSNIAAPLLILDLTHSPAQAGLAAALGKLPFLLVSLPAGALVDRWNRKQVMILCDLGRALNLVFFLLALFTGHLTIIQIYINLFIEGIFSVFFNIAQVASLPLVVGKKQLSASYSVDLTLANSAMLAGPPLGGLLYAFNNAVPFLADTISYLVSTFSLLLVKTSFQRERELTLAKRSLRREIVAGVLYLWRQPLFRFMAFFGGGLNFVLATNTLIVIVLAQQQKASPVTIGLIFTIGSIGGILGALLGAQVQKRLHFGWSIIGFFWLLVLLWPLYALAPNPLILGMVTGGIFIVDPVLSVVYMSYRMTLTPDEFQGRLNSTHRLIAFSFGPLGVALAGVLLQYVGTTLTILVFAGVLLLMGICVLLNPLVRKAVALDG
ncbi:MAG: MFS transporter [Ktedonobacteraceae bacterium]